VPAAPWRVRSVEVLPEFELKVEFNDGLSGTVKMKRLVRAQDAGKFRRLADPTLFAQAGIELAAATAVADGGVAAVPSGATSTAADSSFWADVETSSSDAASGPMGNRSKTPAQRITFEFITAPHRAIGVRRNIAWSQLNTKRNTLARSVPTGRTSPSASPNHPSNNCKESTQKCHPSI